ncbi:MAG TPA: Na+/H+ antiporter NhaA [Polyangiaceae bacterium]|nr:Na+/H+ antiporter NhaA [Polyangiaceae bacterium]
MTAPPKSLVPSLRVVGGAFEKFLALEAASGLVLVAATAIALVWENSPFAWAYDAVFTHAVALPFLGARTVRWLVNDGLMVVFFFVVGLEIRKEAYDGSLSDLRRAALPVVAAVGGMLAPAGAYLLLAGEPAIRRGWGVPMATDIAFAVGVLVLLGRRVPPALRVLLLAVAVIDDIGSIFVIAFFYSSGIAPLGLAVVGASVLAILGLQALSVRRPMAYVVPAFFVWAGTYGAGIHPTIAGVLLGALTPVKKAESEREAPSERLVHALHPWVSFGILPVFALANAGVPLGSVAADPQSVRVLAGVALGLGVGKPLGILVASHLATRLGVAALPWNLGFRHLVVLGLVAGIGFTMALFVADLAFAEPVSLVAAKLGILVASFVAAIVGVVAGRVLLPDPVAPEASRS